MEKLEQKSLSEDFELKARIGALSVEERRELKTHLLETVSALEQTCRVIDEIQRQELGESYDEEW